MYYFVCFGIMEKSINHIFYTLKKTDVVYQKDNHALREIPKTASFQGQIKIKNNEESSKHPYRPLN